MLWSIDLQTHYRFSWKPVLVVGFVDCRVPARERGTPELFGLRRFMYSNARAGHSGTMRTSCISAPDRASEVHQSTAYFVDGRVRACGRETPDWCGIRRFPRRSVRAIHNRTRRTSYMAAPKRVSEARRNDLDLADDRVRTCERVTPRQCRPCRWRRPNVRAGHGGTMWRSKMYVSERVRVSHREDADFVDKGVLMCELGTPARCGVRRGPFKKC